MGDDDMIRRRDVLDHVGLNAWKHEGDDPYSKGMDAGARHQAQVIYDALRALPAAPRLSDPVTVHANMLRGSIAKPTIEQIVHLYGADALRAALPAAPAEDVRAGALREAADSLLEASVWCDSQERTTPEWHNGVVDARKHHIARIIALIPEAKP